MKKKKYGVLKIKGKGKKPKSRTIVDKIRDAGGSTSSNV